MSGEEEPAKLKRVERNARGELIARLEGKDKPIENVRIARCFPWSLADEYISVCDTDGKEIVLLRDLDGIDPASRELIRAEVRDKFFVPKIRRITRYSRDFEMISISAETDRGKITFQIRKRGDVRLLSSVRALLRDVDGNVYEIEDIDALDRASRKHVEHYF